jgi:hypothetical protein
LIARVARTVFAVAVVVAVFVAAWFLFARTEGDDVGGLGAAGPAPFDGTGSLPPGPSRAVYSPTGARLAVLQAGRVDMAVGGAFRRVTRANGNVVDVAWFGNSSTLLVAEGPASTGGLAVVDIDGTVRGSVPLDGAHAFGTGHGMSVAPGGKRAALTAVTRPALTGEQRHVVEVDLESGAVRDVTTVGGPDEYGPRYLDDGTLVYSTADDRVVGVYRGADAIRVRGGRLVTARGRDLGGLPPAVTVVDVAPEGDRAVVVARDEEGQPRLREIRLDAGGSG